MPWNFNNLSEVEEFRKLAISKGMSSGDVDSFISSKKLPAPKMPNLSISSSGELSSPVTSIIQPTTKNTLPTTPSLAQDPAQGLTQTTQTPDVSKPKPSSGFSMGDMLVPDQKKDLQDLGGSLPSPKLEITPTPSPTEQELKIPSVQQPALKPTYQVPDDQIEKINSLSSETKEPMLELLQKGNEAFADSQYEPFIFEAFRSNERQAQLYAQGRTKGGNIVTKARPGQSPHNVGKAVDIYFRDKKTGKTLDPDKAQSMGLYKKMGKVGKALGLTHGGTDWGWDDPHFELSNF
ncbi:MAG: M15 family metallopeptidase [bacterium]|nr:M15 family metallopeptidase [bacterium]